MTPGRRALYEKLADPLWYIRRMGIYDKRGRKTDLRVLKPGQLDIIKAITCSELQQTCILKPRQIGSTTIVSACLVWLAMFSPDMVNTISVAHDQVAMKRVNEMLRLFLQSTPAAWRPTLKPDNHTQIQLAHNKSMFVQSMAGGRNAGRSFTFHSYHATEMGLWPKGSSAHQKNDTKLTVDRDVHASILSTIDMSNPRARVVIESTADGPLGIFYDTVATARTDPRWNFLFFPWTMYDEYELDPLPGFELTKDERELADAHFDFWDPENPSVESAQRMLRKLAWRRNRIVGMQYGLTRFRREFPLTWEEPFLVDAKMWFDVERLNRSLAGIDPAALNNKSTYKVFAPFEEGRKYFMGADPSGGTGGDEAINAIVRDDLKLAAIWGSNTTAPRAFADEVAKMSAKWGKAAVLVESNNHGKAVLSRLRELGVPLWRKNRKDWFTDRRTKFQMYDWFRHLVEGGFVDIEDPETIRQLMKIREQRNGDIRADDGYHDDRAMAVGLALFHARKHGFTNEAGEIDVWKQRARRKKRALQERGLR